MAASQPLVAADVLAAYRLDRHRCLLDLGGGDGTFLIHAAAAAPHLKLMLFDLPAVAERARARFDRGRAGRPGPGVRRRFPHRRRCRTGADIVSLVRVIHDHNDDAALAILNAAWQALPPGGTLLLAEPMAGTPSAGGWRPISPSTCWRWAAAGRAEPRN